MHCKAKDNTRSDHPGIICGTACTFKTEDDFVTFYNFSSRMLRKVTQNSDDTDARAQLSMN